MDRQFIRLEATSGLRMTLGTPLEHPPASFYTAKEGKSKQICGGWGSPKLSQHCSLPSEWELLIDKILGNVFNSNPLAISGNYEHFFFQKEHKITFNLAKLKFTNNSDTIRIKYAFNNTLNLVVCK